MTTQDYKDAQEAARRQKAWDTHATQNVHLSLMDCIACASIFIVTGFTIALIG